MRKLVLSIMVLSLSILGFTSAQVSSQSIIINPHANFGVEVYVNKDYSGTSVPTYSIGEAITISVRPNQDAYVYLFNINSYGQIVQLLPNRLPGGQNNYVRAGQTRTFPAGNEGFNYTVEGPAGNDQIIALASRTPLNTSQLVQFSQDPFARGQGSIEIFANTLSIIVQPIPVQSWVSDMVYINIVNAYQPQPVPVMPPPVQPVQPIYPIPPTTPQPLPNPSGLLSSCANLYAPRGVSIGYINDYLDGSEAILYTRETLYDIYDDLLYQLEAQGYYEYEYYEEPSVRRLEATIIRGQETINLRLERRGGIQEIGLTIFCSY